ncbi:hypothetical protein Avbf_13279 [Armadillidium vulgare]|nr:hypothetical protein Avbf_13279 [Armadillidium vulgare]
MLLFLESTLIASKLDWQYYNTVVVAYSRYYDTTKLSIV